MLTAYQLEQEQLNCSFFKHTLTRHIERRKAAYQNNGFQTRDGESIGTMTVEELVKLPGVGRKTANVITSVIDQQPNMAVDTHVFRVSARLGLTRGAKTPLAAEKQLIQHIPSELVHRAHHWLILHGRYTCLARNPKCDGCGLTEICLYYKKLNK